MNEHIRKLVNSMECQPPATEEVLRSVELETGITFPLQYKEFMLESNGAEGSIGENSYLALWHIEEIIELNEGYNVKEYYPGLVFFGSDGGGMVYAFNYRIEGVPIMAIPLDSIHIKDAKLCGNTFEEFLQYLYDAEE